ncbi:unnamed protein product [Cylicostephanus goldi]|uniref:DNA mismatch repair protein MutS-like N-terminal domain-containing protein n=1 Tax=Cylicostephanus goldi TaxID=71465 RepID=A0A3P6S3E4_CYLGO|nr:unnamed protein product [Cylicostephanus goldi]
MSAKRQSSLFSFFTPKTGAANTCSTPKSTKVKEPVKREPANDPDPDIEEESRTLKRVNNEADSSPVFPNKKPVKRRRVILSSDDEGDDEDENLLSVRTPPAQSNVVSSSTPMATEFATPKSARPLRPLKECPTPLSTAEAESFIDSFRIEDDLDVSAASIDTLDRTIYQVESTSRNSLKEDKLAMVDEEKFPHETLPFLQPENIRDAQGRRPNEDDYDPTTLFVPADFLKEQSPGHRQWWTIKSKNFDTILLFKVGKFYETYHMDAMIAVECLGLSFMRVSTKVAMKH